MSSSSTDSRLDALAGLHAAKRLVRRLATGELGAHAVLLYGLPGSGKHALARILAESWLCLNPTEAGADGTCRACSAMDRGNCADFLLVTPSGASQIILTKQITNDSPKDDDPVSVLSFLRTMPLMARHKVVLIEDAHRMNSGSANALLKTLEEPHSYAKLILTTDSVGGILPTILSRCIAVPCELPTRAQIESLAPGASPDLIRLADGAPARVARAVAKPAPYEALAAFARQLLVSPPSAALVLSDRFKEIAEMFADDEDKGARAGNARALELLATWLAREPESPAGWPQIVVEAHRAILGNCNSSLVFDALFSGLLTESS